MRTKKDQPFFFSVKHIMKPVRKKLLYGIRYKNLDYFLFKSFGINDCEQLDSNPKLDTKIFNTICEVITEVELGYNKTPPLEFINMDVFNILARIKNPGREDHPANDEK